MGEAVPFLTWSWKWHVQETLVWPLLLLTSLVHLLYFGCGDGLERQISRHWLKLQGMIALFKYLKGGHTEEGQNLFLVIPEYRTHNNGLKLQGVRFRLNIRKKI